MFSRLKNIFSNRLGYDRYPNSKIIIFGWTRTGSSNLGEIVKTITNQNITYEPFHPKKAYKVKSVKGLKKQLQIIFEENEGLKHVTRIGLEFDKYLLNHPDHKIIFLWRENVSKRVISEFLARQTKVYGSLNNNKQLRKELENETYEPIDISSFNKTCKKYKQEVEFYRSIMLESNKEFFEVKFEELFNQDHDQQKEFVENLCGFLNVSFSEELFETIKWRFEDKMKQSSDKIYRAIPNIAEINKLTIENNYGKLY
jgi:hypothetical protein